MIPDTHNAIIISSNLKARNVLSQALSNSPYKIILEGSSLEKVLSEMTSVMPDIIVLALESTDLSVLKHLQIILQQFPLPIVIFSDDGRNDVIAKAIDLGVSAYVVDGLDERRVESILTTAIFRFKQYQKVQQQVDDLKVNLADRKIIDRAKGLIMSQKQCSEDEAYKLLRSSAMKQNVRLATLSQNIIDTAALLAP
ncbi:MAG: antitermination regulator [Gammaproteobacteria bacterium]|nr:MAG: antitermination regulator [Gammaproteobacteria bacterium]